MGELLICPDCGKDYTKCNCSPAKPYKPLRWRRGEPPQREALLFRFDRYPPEHVYYGYIIDDTVYWTLDNLSKWSNAYAIQEWITLSDFLAAIGDPNE